MKFFPYPLNLGTDIVHLPRITRLLTLRPTYLQKFTNRILSAPEQNDLHRRFYNNHNDTNQPPIQIKITPDLTRYLAGRFAAKEAARKAAPAASGASSLGWKDVLVRARPGPGPGESGSGGSGSGRPEIVYLNPQVDGGGQVGRLSISHDGEYVVATVLAVG